MQAGNKTEVVEETIDIQVLQVLRVFRLGFAKEGVCVQRNIGQIERNNNTGVSAGTLSERVGSESALWRVPVVAGMSSASGTRCVAGNSGYSVVGADIEAQCTGSSSTSTVPIFAIIQI